MIFSTILYWKTSHFISTNAKKPSECFLLWKRLWYLYWLWYLAWGPICCYTFQRRALMSHDREVDSDFWKGDSQALSHLEEGRVPSSLRVTAATAPQAWQQQQQEDLHAGTLTPHFSLLTPHCTGDPHTLCRVWCVTLPSVLSIPATAPACLHSTELFLSLLWLDPDLVLRRLVWVQRAQLAAGGTFTGEKTTFGIECNV